MSISEVKKILKFPIIMYKKSEQGTEIFRICVLLQKMVGEFG